MEKNEKKNKNGFISWLSNNRVAIMSGICGIVIGCLVMLIFWPSRIAVLENGEEPVLSVDNLTVTANDLYTKLKDTYGISVLLEMVDKNLLDQEYDLEEEASEYAESTAENYYTQY